MSVFNFFQQDTFYYLAIAKNSSLGFFTYDGELSTSGFHPLWQVCFTVLFKLMGEVGKDILIFGVFFLRFALVTVEYCLIGLAIYNCTGSKLLSVRIVPGFFHVAFSFVMRFGGSVWKYMNGMETCLSIFFGGLLLYSLSRRSDGRPDKSRDFTWYVSIGTLLGLIVMARLDDVLLLERDDFRTCLKKAVMTALPGCILLVWYLAHNMASLGSAIPISGMEKGDSRFLTISTSLFASFPPTSLFRDKATPTGTLGPSINKY